MKINEDKSFAVLRIIFGLIWAIDAFFKWSPNFINNFVKYLTQGAQGQPVAVQVWINFWIKSVSINPHFFAYFVAIIETLIALGLIFGFLVKYVIPGGIALALVIWSTAEGFGGPYSPGSTDIGTAIIYVIVFVALWLGKSGKFYSLDSWFKKKKFLFFK